MVDTIVMDGPRSSAPYTKTRRRLRKCSSWLEEARPFPDLLVSTRLSLSGERCVARRFGVDTWVLTWRSGTTVDRSPRRLPPEFWRRRVHEVFLRHARLRSGDFVIDVGAGYGTELAEFSGLVGPAGSILAIEAHPASFFRLQLQVELNALSNVRPLCAAIGNVRDVVGFGETTGMHSSALGPDGLVRVPQVQLDDAVPAGSRVSLLKINVEGAEVGVLEGAARTLQRTENVCVSCHDFKIDGEEATIRERVVRLLLDAGFELRFVDDPDLPEWQRSYVYGSRTR